MRRALAHPVLAGLLLLAACGGGGESAAPVRPASSPPPEVDEKISFRLREQNRSGSSGRATLDGGDGGFTVTLALRRPGSSGPAHIHNVTCAEYRAMRDFDAQFATVEVNMTDLERGKSKTQVDAALSRYRRSGHSINVHSYAGGFPVVACGDIP